MDENKKEEENFIFNKRTFIFNTKDQINNKYEKIEQLGKSPNNEIYTVKNKEKILIAYFSHKRRKE